MKYKVYYKWVNGKNAIWEFESNRSRKEISLDMKSWADGQGLKIIKISQVKLAKPPKG